MLGLAFFTGGEQQGTLILLDASALVTEFEEYQGKELRVRGFVKPGSVLLYGDEADFIIEQDGEELAVHFNGKTQLPDTFTDSSPVRVDGYLNEKNLLVASKVEAKCASKYEAEQHPEGVPYSSSTTTISTTTNP